MVEPARTAVIGIGHELRGDDAAGVLLTRTLADILSANENVLLVEGGAAPENSLGVIRRFRPGRVIMVDTAEMGASPGTVRWLDWQKAEGLSASTHTLPLALLARYLTVELGCRVELLAIQPETNWLDAPLSPAVKQGMAEALARLRKELQ